jgi:multiple sugar transport system ATP-binding protein
MIYVTHDQVEAMTMADRIAVMKDGVVQQVADPLGLYNEPASLFVAGFIGSPPMNFFQGRIERRADSLLFVEGTSANSNGGFNARVPSAHQSKVTAYEGKPLTLGLRPEHVIHAPPATQDSQFTATIEIAERMGAETYWHLSTGAHSLIARVGSGEKAGIGEKASLSLDMSHAHFFDAATGKAIR